MVLLVLRLNVYQFICLLEMQQEFSLSGDLQHLGVLLLELSVCTVTGTFILQCVFFFSQRDVSGDEVTLRI